MRAVTYAVAGLGTLAWAFPLAEFVAILSGLEKGLVAAFVRESLISDPPYGGITMMILGVVLTLLAPIMLRGRGHPRWALGLAIISLAVAFVVVYGPWIIGAV